MEKFGVDEGTEDLEKRAQQGCPKCGGKVERKGPLLFCERCGSEPFEQPKDQ